MSEKDRIRQYMISVDRLLIEAIHQRCGDFVRNFHAQATMRWMIDDIIIHLDQFHVSTYNSKWGMGLYASREYFSFSRLLLFAELSDLLGQEEVS